MIFEKQIVNNYKGMMYTRCDDTETAFYFSAKDFDGLNAEPYSFTASGGHTLKGYIYSYDAPKDGRLIVFDHGFGGGHLAYMKEIELLCRHGYRVLSYDHTGCMESGGDSPRGLAQSLCDLNDCMTAIKNDDKLNKLDVSVIGHSWGAFSSMNIVALHPEISHVVALCGFVSVREMVNTFFSGMLKGYRKAVYALEEETNPIYTQYNSAKSLKDTNAKALLIYSEDDPLCRRNHYDILRSELDGKENIRFIFVNEKGHNPNYTKDAVKLLGEFTKSRTEFTKNKNTTKEDKEKFVASFDWHKMTEQDEALWQEIFNFLDN